MNDDNDDGGDGDYQFSSVMCPVEYTELCPGGTGFRPNVVTVILEGSFLNSKENLKLRVFIDQC